MSEILNKYKKQKQRLLLNTQKYLDFVLSLDNSKTINLDGNLTKKCLISYIDTNNEECFDDKSLVSMSGYTYENSINEGETLKDLGFTNVDNGHIYYDKNELTLDDFVNIITNVSYTLPQNDERLHLYPVNGNSQYYTYNTEVVSESGSTYYAMKGGYLQGFYKLYGFNYQVLPQDIENCWCLEFVIRPRTDYVVSGNTINDEHPNNKGIFFYMGTRSENKFGRFYGEDLTKYLSRQNYSGECFEICEKKEGQETDKELNRKLLEIMYGVDNVKCKSYTDDEVENMLSGLTLCKVDLSTSDGHKLENNNYFEITTDNKFIIFDRTCGGFTTNNWNNDNVLSLIQKKIVNHENLFLLMDRTCKGKTTSTIENYLNSTTGDSSDYSILKDIKGNAFALKINDDWSIGYRYLINDCDNENGYSVVEEKTYPEKINPNFWNVINVVCKIVRGGTDDCGLSFGNRKMRIYIYVNGYLKLVSKELPEFRFRELDDFYDKQECVPYNISLGGGTQGLIESMWVDNYTRPYCKILPIEENFCGSFIGDIRSFKFYDCQLQYNEIKNNYMYENTSKTENDKNEKLSIDKIYFGIGGSPKDIIKNGIVNDKLTQLYQQIFVTPNNENVGHFYFIISKKYTGKIPFQFICGGVEMIVEKYDDIIDSDSCTIFKSAEQYPKETELSITTLNN